MNRILFQPDELAAEGRIVLSDDRAEHIRSVLRAKPHDIVRVGILNGPCGVGEVLSLADASVELACRFESAAPIVPSVDLLLAMPRPKVMKRLWAPLASMGLGRIIITCAARVERNYFDTHWLDKRHFEPRLIEGLQQTGITTHLPEVTVVRRFRPFIEDQLDAMCPDTLRLVAHPREGVPMGAALTEQQGQRLLLAVGPEGGWVPFELDLMQRAGFRRVTLPFGALRTDVGCIALLAAVGMARAEATDLTNTHGTTAGSVA